MAKEPKLKNTNPIKGINHVTILVKDKNKAREFYVNILGLEEYRVGKLLWIKVGNQFLHLTENSGNSIGNSFYHFALEAENVDGYISDLRGKGVKFFSFDAHGGKIEITGDEAKERQFFIEDPDGNLIEFLDTANHFFHP